MELADLGIAQMRRLLRYAQQLAIAPAGSAAHECIEPPAQDRRFQAPEWHAWPFNLMHQSFLLGQEWWDAATHGVAGVSRHHEQVVAFAARQLLDMFSPGNFLPTNPVVLRQTLASGGMNLARGAVHAVEDFERLVGGARRPAPRTSSSAATSRSPRARWCCATASSSSSSTRPPPPTCTPSRC